MRERERFQTQRGREVLASQKRAEDLRHREAEILKHRESEAGRWVKRLRAQSHLGSDPTSQEEVMMSVGLLDCPLSLLPQHSRILEPSLMPHVCDSPVETACHRNENERV